MGPSKLQIHTNVVTRLIKEEKSYHKEVVEQEKQIKALEEGQGGVTASNIEQEKKALEETHKVIPHIQQKLKDAMERLEEMMIEFADDTEGVEKAKEVLAQGKEAVKDS